MTSKTIMHAKCPCASIALRTDGARTTSSSFSFAVNEQSNGYAENKTATNRKNTAFAKPPIGDRFSDPVFRDDMTILSIEVVQSDSDNRLVQDDFKGETKRFTLEEIPSMVLTKMWETTEAVTLKGVYDAGVECLANVNDSQRHPMKDTGLFVF